MIIQGWDWNSLHILITTAWFLSHHRWWQFQFLTPLLHQDPVCLDWFKQLTAPWPFQCHIISIMNDHTRLRLEFIILNGHNNLFVSHELIKMWLLPHPLFTPRSSVFGLIQAIDSTLTLPTSHCKYWMATQGWDWSSFLMIVTTTCFWVSSGGKCG